MAGASRSDRSQASIILFTIRVHCRLGVVPVEEASVVIAVSSVHRRDSLEAVHWAIDTLKGASASLSLCFVLHARIATVPIWKKEWYADGSVWKQNQVSTALFVSLISIQEFSPQQLCCRHNDHGHAAKIESEHALK
jgi:hypothetical protein